MCKFIRRQAEKVNKCKSNHINIEWYDKGKGKVSNIFIEIAGGLISYICGMMDDELYTIYSNDITNYDISAYYFIQNM